MKTIERILPYQRQPVLYAVYDVLDAGGGDYQMDKVSNCITAELTVYGNKSIFAISVSDKAEDMPKVVLTVSVTDPGQGLSPQGEQRAVDYLGDSVEQLLENELS